MNHRDVTIDVQCILCGSNYSIRVNSEDYENFKNNNIADIDKLENIFPYLDMNDIDFITTKICSNCS